MDLLEIGTTPISEDNPAGDDVRFEPEFEELENEILKLSSPSMTEGIDWDKLIVLCKGILSEKSKNLIVSNHLCIALLKTEGLEGLANGVHILRGMYENFWENLYPPKKRMRRRVNAISWWSDKIEAELENMEMVVWPKEKREAILRAAPCQWRARSRPPASWIRSFAKKKLRLMSGSKPRS